MLLRELGEDRHTADDAVSGTHGALTFKRGCRFVFKTEI